MIRYKVARTLNLSFAYFLCSFTSSYTLINSYLRHYNEYCSTSYLFDLIAHHLSGHTFQQPAYLQIASSHHYSLNRGNRSYLPRVCLPFTYNLCDVSHSKAICTISLLFPAHFSKCVSVASLLFFTLVISFDLLQLASRPCAALRQACNVVTWRPLPLTQQAWCGSCGQRTITSRAIHTHTHTHMTYTHSGFAVA